MVQNLPPESEPDLRRAVELDPGNAEAWTWLGNLLQNQNRLKEALEASGRRVTLTGELEDARSEIEEARSAVAVAVRELEVACVRGRKRRLRTQ